MHFLQSFLITTQPPSLKGDGEKSVIKSKHYLFAGMGDGQVLDSGEGQASIQQTFSLTCDQNGKRTLNHSTTELEQEPPKCVASEGRFRFRPMLGRQSMLYLTVGLGQSNLNTLVQPDSESPSGPTPPPLIKMLISPLCSLLSASCIWRVG